MKHVIIGSGVAGIAAVEAIRSVDKSGQITLIGDDPHGYYSRPGLAYYLTGEIHDQALFVKKQDDFQKSRVRYLKGRVKRVLRDQHYLEVEGQAYVAYDRLLLALGSLSIALEIPGSTYQGVLKLDHLSDAQQIIKLAKKGKTAVVVGGGITALELVEGLAARGMHVHYLLRGDRFWSNVLDFQESKIIEQRLKEEGVTLRYHSEITEITGRHNRVASVRLKDGMILPCDLLAYAIGVQPQTELAKQAALEVDRGILVNEYLQTNDPDIFAAGDVAQVYDPFTKRSVIESLWTPAREQGTAAGLNMAGRKKAYVKSVPFNVTRLANLTTTIIGTVGQGRDEDLMGIARGDSETWRQLPDAMVAQNGFEVNRLRVMVGEHTLLGAIIMGDQTLSTPLEKIISNKVNISSIRDALLTPNANVSDVLAGFWSNFRERGLNVQQRTVPKNSQPALSNSASVRSNAQKTIPTSTRLSQRGTQR
ncbi:MAG: FAD-dependent oxidoreductase [Chloroflexota bacterium]